MIKGTCALDEPAKLNYRTVHFKSRLLATAIS